MPRRTKKDEEADPEIIFEPVTEPREYIDRLAYLRHNQHARERPVDRHTLSSATQQAPQRTKND